MGHKPPRCWLHIGAPKTGSTALQVFLDSNRGALAENGAVYPSATLRGHGHHDLAFLSSGGYPDWATPQERPLVELIAELRQEISTTTLPVVLSSENFYLLCSPVRVAKLLEQIGIPINAGEVKIVVYVRRQDDALVSWYNQAVKAQGYGGSLDEHIAENWSLWDYEARLEPWANVFGKANLIVRPYQLGDLSGRDIRRDFLGILGIPEKPFEFPQERINTHINRDILEFQRLMNRLPLPPQGKRRFHKELMALTAASAEQGIFSDEPLLQDGQRREILARYDRGNKNLAETHLGRGALFTDIAPSAAEGARGEAGLTIEKLTYILGWLLTTQEGGT